MLLYCRQEALSYSSGYANFAVKNYMVELDDDVAREVLAFESNLFMTIPFPNTPHDKPVKPKRQRRSRVENDETENTEQEEDDG